MQKKDQKSSIAAVASATVDGYLRNASKRQRVPAPEGGRGTRRKTAMVTSANLKEEKTTPMQQELETVNADEVDEWDEVELPTVAVKRQKKEEEESVEVKKIENDRSGLKDAVATETSKVKQEAIEVDGEEETNLTDLVPAGTRPPLIEQPSASRWNRDDSAYAALREEKELLAAERRSKRMHIMGMRVFELIALMLRGKFLYRESQHFKLKQLLLSVHVQKDVPDTQEQDGVSVSASNKKTTRKSAARKRVTKNEERKSKNYSAVFVEAVLKCKSILTESTRAPSKPSLAPSWVTSSKDTANCKTSEMVKVLLTAIHSVFILKGSEDAEKSERFSSWYNPLEPKYLYNLLKLKTHTTLAPDERIELESPVYFTLIFLSLASLCFLRTRIVIGKEVEKTPKDGEDSASAADAPRLEKMSIFHSTSSTGKRARNSGDNNFDEEGNEETEKDSDNNLFANVNQKKKGAPPRGKRSKKSEIVEEVVKSTSLPTSCFWSEVWSPERQNFIAVNPCAFCSTLWGSPYTFSINGDTVTDATPRYISKMSAAYHYGRRLGSASQGGFFFRNRVAWDDPRETSEVIIESFNLQSINKKKEVPPLVAIQRAREEKQLNSLRYSESIPTTITGVQQHPLFVIETQLARHEGVYPKNETTCVGCVKGHMVYKRSAVVSLRSKDGWLREGRSLLDENIPPYKTMPPPASRPFAAPSQFFGYWQTKPFEPLPLDATDDSFPQHGRTSWYILLDHAPPSGIVHFVEPSISRVARRMRLDFKLAVVGFTRQRVQEQRRGRWEANINGIVVKQRDAPTLLKAYKEWMELVQEQEAAKRRARAFQWWMLLSQRLLSLDRLQNQYLQGTAFGSLPSA